MNIRGRLRYKFPQFPFSRVALQILSIVNDDEISQRRIIRPRQRIVQRLSARSGNPYHAIPGTTSKNARQIGSLHRLPRTNRARDERKLLTCRTLEKNAQTGHSDFAIACTRNKRFPMAFHAAPVQTPTTIPPPKTQAEASGLRPSNALAPSANPARSVKRESRLYRRFA